MPSSAAFVTGSTDKAFAKLHKQQHAFFKLMSIHRLLWATARSSRLGIAFIYLFIYFETKPQGVQVALRCRGCGTGGSRSQPPRLSPCPRGARPGRKFQSGPRAGNGAAAAPARHRDPPLSAGDSPQPPAEPGGGDSPGQRRSGAGRAEGKPPAPPPRPPSPRLTRCKSLFGSGINYIPAGRSAQSPSSHSCPTQRSPCLAAPRAPPAAPRSPSRTGRRLRPRPGVRAGAAAPPRGGRPGAAGAGSRRAQIPPRSAPLTGPSNLFKAGK